MRLRARIRAATGRPRKLSDAERWSAYLAGVEPVVAAVPRVQRFARPSVVADVATEADSVAVWIEGGDEDRGSTAAGLESSTLGPAAVLHGALDEALAQTRSERVLLVGAGDVLAPLALERLGQAARLAPDAHVITSDDDELDAAGRRRAPRFRPGPSPDRWLACDDSGSHAAGRPAACSRTPGSAERASRLAARTRGPPGRAERASAPPTCRCCCRTGHASAAARFPWSPRPSSGSWRRGTPAPESSATATSAGSAVPLSGEPSIEVIVCLRDRPELLRRCVDSLLEQTDYERLAVTLVDNGSQEPRTA